jgi:hypothetical protein
MEINITKFFKETAARDYSASAQELGQNAGTITWNNAVEDSPEYFMLDDDDKREAFRKFVEASGGWSESEINAWDDYQLNALLLQWIAGDIREADLDQVCPDWAAYEEDSREGNIAGRVFLDEGGEIYFYIDS